MSKYGLGNALNLRAVVVAVILAKAVRRALRALKEFLLSREDNGREDMALKVSDEGSTGSLELSRCSVLILAILVYWCILGFFYFVEYASICKSI